MDTETFLTERQVLLSRLRARRDAVLHERSTKSGFLGLGWSDWSRLAMGLGSNSVAGRWLPRLLASSAVPLVVAFLRNKALSYVHRKTPWEKILGVLSFIKPRPE